MKRLILRNLLVDSDRAVMDTRNNLANQEVFHIAKAADKEGIRTVGIMTKCDALQKGDEPAVSNNTIHCALAYTDRRPRPSGLPRT